MKISLIVAKGLNNEIGIDNRMPWNHLKADLKHFKEITSGHCVIMGRKCFESIGKPLPNRTNIIISRSNINYDGCITTSSLEYAINMAKEQNDSECFIIGGGMIYKYALENIDIDNIYVTEVQSTFDNCSVFFPTFNEEKWKKEYITSASKDPDNDYDMSFYKYSKI